MLSVVVVDQLTAKSGQTIVAYANCESLTVDGLEELLPMH